MSAARTDRALFYRSPVAVGDEEDRPVLGRRRRNWRIFVQNLEAVELDDVIILVLHVGIELSQCELLETPDGGGWTRVDADGIPRLENLSPQVENSS
jgi:hypothetical protein